MKIIDLLRPDELDNINKLIKSYDKNDEFEVSLFSNKETSMNLLTLERFNNLNSILSIITSKNEEKYKKITTQILDINMTIRNLDNKENMIVYRLSIDNLDKINEYMNMLHMRRNHLVFTVLLGYFNDKTASDNHIHLMKKTKNYNKYVTLEDIYTRFKLDKEEKVSNEENKKLMKINKSFDANTYNINFRFKERTSYYILKNKNIFRIDLTMVRTSDKINSIENSIYSYEIEVECEIHDKNTLLNELLSILEFIIKSIQGSNYITTKSINNKVLSAYKDILNITTDRHNLYARQPISLEVQHVVDQLPNKYAVTDKADGDRYFLIICDTRCYLISTNLIVKDTGINVDKKFNNSILDGEYIFVSKYNKYLYMAFDCIRIGDNNIKEENNLIIRLESMNEFIDNINKTKYKKIEIKDYTNIEKVKETHKQNLINLYEDIHQELKSDSKKIIFRKKYFMDCNGTSDNEIFKYTNYMWNIFSNDSNLKCPYLLDGLIYHPLEQKYTVDINKSKYFEYKWKPAHHNSIDFYIEFEKDKTTGKILKVFDNSISDKLKNKSYMICNLHVGDVNNNVETPVLFGVKDSISQAYIYLDDTDIPRSTDGKQITDKTVVEFYYNTDDDLQKQFRWIPMKTRFDKTESVQKFNKKYGNNEHIANKIWHSIINPVRMIDFATLSDDKLYDNYTTELKEKIDFNLIKLERKDNIYFQKKTTLIKDMGKFHNWIKSNMIYTYVNFKYDDIQKKVLDVACGKGQDLQKFYYTEVKLYVGFDPDYAALTDSGDGAISRYKGLKKTHERFPPCYFINADATTILQYDEQVRKIGRMTQDNKKLFDKFLTWDNNRTLFDTMNCQFAIHYFLSDENSWNNFTDNINMYLRDGGYFMFTTFDGDRVNDKFKNGNNFSEYYDNNGDKTLLFDITKKYDDKNKSNFGNAIDVHMAWLFEDGVYRTEYLVFKDFIIKSLKERCQLELVETCLFEDLFNDAKEFLKLSSEIEEQEKRRKFFKDVYEYYNESEINKKCYNYSFLNRFYVFRKIETNLMDVKNKFYSEKFIKGEKNNKNYNKNYNKNNNYKKNN
jgi:SAM-dependent methyltransferase